MLGGSALLRDCASDDLNAHKALGLGSPADIISAKEPGARFLRRSRVFLGGRMKGAFEQTGLLNWLGGARSGRMHGFRPTRRGRYPGC